MTAQPPLQIQVVCAESGSQRIVALTVPSGATLYQAVCLSQLAEGREATLAMGIYGKLKSPDTPAQNGDRIELYRPLTADPKVVRRTRAKKRAI